MKMGVANMQQLLSLFFALQTLKQATTNAGIAFAEALAGTGLGALNNLITNMYKAFSQAFDNIEQKLNNARGE